MKILYFINHKPFFVSHRLPIALQMIRNGHMVHLLTGKSSDKIMEKYAKKIIKKNNIKSNELNIDSSSLSTFKNIINLYSSYKFIKKLNPDIIHSASMKANIISGLCGILLRKPVVLAFSGFGYIFTENNLQMKIFKKIIAFLLKIIFLNNKKHIIVQNSYDLKFLKNNFNIKSNNITKLNGSGVPISKNLKIKNKKKIVLFPSRVLTHKGIIEFIEAATVLKKKYKNWKFLVVGSYKDNNPAALSKEYIKRIHRNKTVIFKSYTSKIKKYFLSSSIVCLPTYREGLPKSLIEACNNGLPIVTTNIPGCELVVRNNYNGFKVPIKNVIDLTNKLEILIQSKVLRDKFGKNSFNIAKKYFDVNKIITKHILIYNKIYNA
tara:strand:- start:2299 stop:3432 length:1134 start_codon:yes stop_codon:yes gene_type:complete